MKWPRYDPHRGYFLCEPYWNQTHINPAFTDRDGVKHPKVFNCQENGCECGCRHGKARAVRFTGEGQTVIDTGDDVIQIGTPKHRDEN